MIESKRTFIHNLITLYPAFYESWEKAYDEDLRKTAIEVANGDLDVYLSMPSWSPVAEYEQDLKNIFYQAMAIEVYSYYESTILYIHKTEKIPGENFVSLKKHKDYTLPHDLQEDNNFVYNKFRVFRDYIAHNVDAEPREEHRTIIEELSQTEKGIKFENEVLTITDGSFLLKALDSEYKVLFEICKQLGYCSISRSISDEHKDHQ